MRATMHARVLTAGLLALLVSVGGAAWGDADSPHGGLGPSPARVVRVIDGDTVVLDVTLWPGLTQRIHLRLAGINAPETRGASHCEEAAGRDAADLVRRLVEGARRLTVRDVRQGKFAGRVLGRLEADGQDVARSLLAAGLARPYHGGARKPWCGEK